MKQLSLVLLFFCFSCVSLPTEKQTLKEEELTYYPQSYEKEFDQKFQKFFYINLDLPGHSVRRRKSMEEFFRKDFSQLERFPGVIGKNLKFSDPDEMGVQKVTLPGSKRQLPYKTTFMNSLSLGELGNHMSHYLVWEEVAKDPNEDHIYLVAEDDIIPKSDFKKRLMSVLYHAPKDWGMIYLFAYQSKVWGCHHNNLDLTKSKRFLKMNKRCIPGTVAYLIHPESAKKLMEDVLPFRNATDRRIRDDFIVKRKLKVLGTYPEILSTEEESVIDEVDGGRKRLAG